MREGWEVKKLEDVTLYKSGTTIKKSLEKSEGDILYIKVGDMNLSGNEKDITTSTRFVDFEDIKESQIIPIGSVIFPKRGGAIATNKKRIIVKPTIVDLNTMAITPKRNISMDYFFYWFKTVNLVEISSGTSIPQINNYSFNKITIEFPQSLNEQKQIVKTLDLAFKHIDQAKANLEKNLKNAKELFASKLNEVFSQRGEGWAEKSLKEVCEITSKLIDPKEEQYQDLVHIGAGNIESKKGTLSNLQTAKEENLISGKFLFDKEMVLYSKIRPYLMKVVKCDFVGLCSADIYPLVPIKDEIIQSFLYYLLLSNNFTEYAITGSQRAGMPKVNRKHLFEYICYLPDIKEQEKKVKKLDILFEQYLNLQTHYQQNLNNLEELKKSILEKAFKGEL